MGMYLTISAVDNETIGKLLSNPPLVWKLLAPDDPTMYEEAQAKPHSTWWSKLFGRKHSNGTALDHTVAPPVEETDLDKSWHAIHYLLTGTAWEGEPPLNFLLLGGSEIGDIEVGYGAARAISAEETNRICAALSEIEESTVLARFSPEQMTQLQIYPDIWDRQDERDELIDYCISNFRDLKGFITRATERDLGIVISIQ